MNSVAKIESRYEMNDKQGHPQALLKMQNPNDCWFSILYFQPLRMKDLLSLTLESLGAFSFIENLDYVRETIFSILKINDPLHIQLMVIASYISVPTIRALFKSHSSEYIWVLAYPHLFSRYRELLLQISQLFSKREELEIWVEACLQPLAFGLVTHIISTWDPGYMAISLREEAAINSVDEAVVEDPTIARLATFKERDPDPFGLSRNMKITALFWNSFSTEMNRLQKGETIGQGTADGLLREHLLSGQGEGSPEIRPFFVISALWINLHRPDRLGCTYPLDTSMPWVPGTPLGVVRENSLKYFRDCRLLVQNQTPK